jgi:hypothetical protein
MPIVNPKTAETEESSEEILARLAKLRDTLDGVSTGDTIETTPTIEVIQTHPALTELLYVNGTPYPGLWVPNYPAFQIHVRGMDDESSCEEISPHTRYVCSSRKDNCPAGFAHVATFGKDYNPIEDIDSLDADMVLEWWSSAAQLGHPVLLGSGSHPSTEDDLPIGDFTRSYAKALSDGTECRANSGHFYCTMNEGHRYSHIAGNGSFILQVWN